MAKNDYYETNGCAIEAVMDPSDVELDGQLNGDLGNPSSSHPSDHYSLAYIIQLNAPGSRPMPVQ